METRTKSATEWLMNQNQLLGRTRVKPGWHREHRTATQATLAKQGRAPLTPAQKRQLRQLTLANAPARNDYALMATMGSIHPTN